MAVPSLPAAKNTNDLIDNAWVDAVRDCLEFFRDNRPQFKGRDDSTDTGTSVLTSTTTEAAFSDGAGAFNDTPIINVGGFTAGTGGENGVYVPETGVYLCMAAANWPANATGYRQLRILDDGLGVSGSYTSVSSVSGTADSRMQTSALRFLTAGDELGVELFQTSGSTLKVATYLSAVWMGSAAS